MTTRTIPLTDAMAIDLSPFGHVVGITEDTPLSQTAFYEGAVELAKPGAFESDHDTAISVARVTPRPFEVIWMERHFKHTQVFLPLGGHPYAVVLAPPTDGELPNLEEAVAIRFPGHLGFMMHIGTWHEFPFALEVATDVVVILRNETNRDLKQLKNDEAEGEDLQKRNLRTRLGMTLAIDV